MFGMLQTEVPRKNMISKLNEMLEIRKNAMQME